MNSPTAIIEMMNDDLNLKGHCCPECHGHDIRIVDKSFNDSQLQHCNTCLTRWTVGYTLRLEVRLCITARQKIVEAFESPIYKQSFTDLANLATKTFTTDGLFYYALSSRSPLLTRVVNYSADQPSPLDILLELKHILGEDVSKLLMKIDDWSFAEVAKFLRKEWNLDS